MTGKMKKIVLLEFVDETKAFLDYCKKQSLPPDYFHIITLQPAVQVFLKQRSIPYENTLPYFSNEEHKNALLKSEEWYQYLLNTLTIEEEREIKETILNTFLFYLRVSYIHYFLMHVELLNTICEKHDVTSIYTCFSHNTINEHAMPHIQDDERYLGLIVKQFVKNRGISWQKIPTVAKSKSTDINSKDLFHNSLNTIDMIIDKFFKLILLKPNKKKRVLLTSAHYNVGKLVEKIRPAFPDVRWSVIVKDEQTYKTFIKFIYFKIFKNYFEEIPVKTHHEDSLQNGQRRQDLEKNLDIILYTLKRNKNYLTYHDVNFIDIFLEKIQKDLLPYSKKILHESIFLRDFLKSSNVKLCISPFARETALLAAELCTNQKIPTLMISHGTLKKPENKLEEIEFHHMGESLILSEFFNYVAVQTPNEIDICRHYKCKNTLIKTGPLIFSKPNIKNRERYKRAILGEIDNKTKIFTYPESTRIRLGMRFHVYETFDEFLSSASDLVDAVNKIENVHLVIRLHAGKRITPAEFKSLLPPSNKLTVTSAEKPFFELLTISDLIINFSSTVIEDALNSCIPVLLYDKQGRYMHTVSQELGKNITPKLNAVYYMKDSAFVKDGLQWILDNHLNRDVPKSIFNRYAFQEDYYINFEKIISNAINV